MTGAASPVTRDARSRAPREVVSFVRRSARLSPQMRVAWEDHASRWVLDVPHGETETSIAAGHRVDLAAEFGRTAPLVVEIGSGMGGSLVPMAQARPEANVLAFEVYQPAVARTLAKLARAGVHNVRLVQANGVEGLATLLEPGSVDELWLFFPDPWPKARHHKRRLVTPDFASLVASRLVTGARWRLATDAEDYAEQMREILDGHEDLTNEHPGGWAPRWDSRPVTRFEERALAADRRVFELTYRRR
ncbi:MAG TPA: tRNA (guanosine(46)-N7)-methyltransferase TrmB [Propionibacteriaceae bacterium]